MRNLILLFLLSYHAMLQAVPQVSVTLKPIHGLVSAIMENVGTPDLLLPDYASPHTFQLKPSVLKQIQQADIIIWVGPELELFMQKPLKQVQAHAKILTLMALPNLKLLPQRHERNWQSDHDDDHDSDHAMDPHFWLSTDNAQVMVIAMTDYLSKADPANAKQYQTNAQKLQARLQQLKIDLNKQLEPVHQAPFLVYHDGYQYFDHEFNLNGVGTLLINPHLPLSANGLKTVQDLIKEKKVKCLFYETEFQDSSLFNHLSTLNVKTAELDPLGARIEKGPENYEKTLYQLASTFKGCLSKN